MIVRECLAHEKAVTQINKHGFEGLLTVAQDCQVRIWSQALDLWGIIDCRHYEMDQLWYFPLRDKQERQATELVHMQVIAD